MKIDKTREDRILKEFLGKEPIAELPDGKPLYYGEKLDFVLSEKSYTNAAEYADHEISQMTPIGSDRQGDPIYFGDTSTEKLMPDEIELSWSNDSYEKRVYMAVTLNRPNSILDVDKFTQSYASDRLKGLGHEQSIENLTKAAAQFNMEGTGEKFLRNLVGKNEVYSEYQSYTNEEHIGLILRNADLINSEITKESKKIRSILSKKDKIVAGAVKLGLDEISRDKSDKIPESEINLNITNRIKETQKRWKVISLEEINRDFSLKAKLTQARESSPKVNLVKRTKNIDKKRGNDKGMSMGM